ncbi:MAG: hypothetical protein ACREV1_05705 [Gammaproteobacteria bacterium]
MTAEDFLTKSYVPSPGESCDARKRRAIAFALSLAIGSPVEAAEWYAEPSVQSGVEYDDNRRLNVQEDEAELSERFIPQLLLGLRTPALDLWTAASAEVIHSSDDDLNRTNVFARLFGNYLTQRSRWDIDANWRRDTTLTTLIVDPLAAPADEVPEPDAVVDPEIGLVRADVERNRIQFRPTYAYQLTELTDLELGYRFFNTFYEENVQGTRLVDRTSHRVLGGTSYKLTPIDNLIGRGDYGRFDSDETSFDQYGAWAGMNHSFSETFFAELLVGFKRTEATGDDEDAGSDTSFVVNATAEKRFETGRALAIFQRDVDQDAFGSARRIEQLDVRYDWEIVPERWFFTLQSQVFRTRSLDLGETVEEDRTYAQVQPRIRWQVTRQLYLDFSYRYRFIDRENAPESADANAALIGLQYVFDRLVMSR